jgi:hypothetical protein
MQAANSCTSGLQLVCTRRALQIQPIHEPKDTKDSDDKESRAQYGTQRVMAREIKLQARNLPKK